MVDWSFSEAYQWVTQKPFESKWPTHTIFFNVSNNRKWDILTCSFWLLIFVSQFQRRTSPLGWSWIILPLVETRPDGNFRSLSLQHFFCRFVIRHFNFISSDSSNSHPNLGCCTFALVFGFNPLSISVVLILRFKQALNYNSCEPSWKRAGNSKWIPVYKI